MFRVDHWTCNLVSWVFYYLCRDMWQCFRDSFLMGLRYLFNSFFTSSLPHFWFSFLKSVCDWPDDSDFRHNGVLMSFVWAGSWAEERLKLVPQLRVVQAGLAIVPLVSQLLRVQPAHRWCGVCHGAPVYLVQPVEEKKVRQVFGKPGFVTSAASGATC